MRIFGFSFATLFLIALAFYLGAKNTGALGRVGI